MYEYASVACMNNSNLLLSNTEQLLVQQIKSTTRPGRVGTGSQVNYTPSYLLQELPAAHQTTIVCNDPSCISGFFGLSHSILSLSLSSSSLSCIAVLSLTCDGCMHDRR